MTSGPFDHQTERLGPLPVVNHFLRRLRVDELLIEFLPAADPRAELQPAQALGVLLRNIILGREPVYGLEGWSEGYAPEVLGLASGQAAFLNDDRVGRALDRLFQADRASLLTALVVGAIQEFGVRLERLHEDSTTITFQGAYENATGRPRRGKPTLRITYGHNKDHRPDLKQLLWSLVISADGSVPVHHRAWDGNTTDDGMHVPIWEVLWRLRGSADFLYVADAKLANREAMGHIAGRGGRFLCVLPRTRAEDGLFREWIQTHPPDWQEVLRRPHPRRRDGPWDIYCMVEAPLPSAEGYRIVWIWNSLKADRDAKVREAAMKKGLAALEALQRRLDGPKSRFGLREKVEEAAEAALEGTSASRWVGFEVEETLDERYRQVRPGRPGPNTRYRRLTRRRFRLHWFIREEVVAYDAKSDGMFPLITNDRNLSLAELLQAYKYQPCLEKRHAQLKSELLVAPVFLKSPARIEALLFCYFISLLVHALIEREVRRQMHAQGITSLPLYPEERACKAPSSYRILEVFLPLARYRILSDDELVQTFQPKLTWLQKAILGLLAAPESAYTEA